MDFNSDNNNNMDDVTVKLNSVRSGRRVSIQEEVVFIENTEKSGCEIYVEEEELKPNIRKDLKKVILLIYLYFLQGIPLGLCASIPFLLSARGVSYSDQGTFSFAFWPFSMKILWAPIVDSLYFKKIGRRKTWLFPVQFIMAIFLFSFAEKVQTLLDSGHTKTDIILLTLVFVAFITLSATQDVAVDGWALSMLSKENVSWQSVCNFCGQAIGFFFGNILFIVLESKKFSNQYLRPFLDLEPQDHGIISLKMFMYTFGTVFLVTAFLIMFVKENELKSVDVEDSEHLNLCSTYHMIWKMLHLAPVRKIGLVVMTCKIGWATDSIVMLKMIENGVSKEKLSLLSVPLIPLNILWPLIVSKYTTGSSPLLFFSRVLPFKLILALLICVFVYFVPQFQNSNGEYEYSFFLICLVVFAASSITDTTLSIAGVGFYARVSDESIGGTYMTFLTTLTNLGGTYPGTAALFLTNWLTKKECNLSTDYMTRNHTISISNGNTCSTTSQSKECQDGGGECVTIFDAFYYLSLGFYVIGFIWLLVFRKTLRNLNNSSKSEWQITKKL